MMIKQTNISIVIAIGNQIEIATTDYHHPLIISKDFPP